jgi:hypothetical protein
MYSSEVSCIVQPLQTWVFTSQPAISTISRPTNTINNWSIQTGYDNYATLSITPQ